MEYQLQLALHLHGAVRVAGGAMRAGAVWPTAAGHAQRALHLAHAQYRT
jgi:hypothetical protein